MLDGFRPGDGPVFFERREVPAAIAAILMVAGPVTWAFLMPKPEETITVELAPEIQDFAVEEEEPEPEVEEEPPPPPPPDAKVKVVKKLKPRPKPSTPLQKPTEVPQESSEEKVHEVLPGARSGGTGLGTKPAAKAKAKPTKPPEKPAPTKPKPKKAAIDPTKPIDRPENATVPKPLPSNAEPKHPAKLRDKGITGKVVIKLQIYRDGSVRGAKILRKQSSATTADEKKDAEKQFLAAVIKAVKTWKYKPATLEGKPITVWHTVTIPFTLTAG